MQEPTANRVLEYEDGAKKKLAVKKINMLKERLISSFMERDKAVEIIILAIISKKHSILIGEPGLAKTALLKSLTGSVSGLKLFDCQMTPKTKLEELLSDNNPNNTGIDNCDIALIDEFFKGPADTLNSLLAIMNERVIYMPEPKPIPLISLFATSNERPDKSSNAGLLPLYDRFLLRKEMLPIKKEENFRKLFKTQAGGLKQEFPMITKEDILLLIAESEKIFIPEEIINFLFRIRTGLKNKQVTVSDRRWRETMSIIKSSALLKGNESADFEDMISIEPSLWTYYSDIRAVKNVLLKTMGKI